MLFETTADNQTYLTPSIKELVWRLWSESAWNLTPPSSCLTSTQCVLLQITICDILITTGFKQPKGVNEVDVQKLPRSKMYKLLTSSETPEEGVPLFDEVVLRMQGVLCDLALPPLTRNDPSIR